MRGQVLPRVHGVLAKGVVGVPAGLAGAAPRPVLGHGADAVLPPAAGGALGGLQAVAVDFPQLCHLGGAGAEGVLKAHPPGLGGQVHLGGQGGGQAQGPVLLGDGLPKGPADLRVEGGGDAQALGPLGDLAPAQLVLRPGLAGPVAGVAAQVHRDAPGQGLRQGLEVVAPPGGGLGRGEAHRQNVPDVVLAQVPQLLVGELPGVLAAFGEGLAPVGAGPGGTGLGRDGLVGRVHHQPGDLLNAQPGGQVLRPGLGVQPPVLVGEKLPGAGQILEVEAVHLEDRGPGGAQVGAVFVVDEGVARMFHEIPPASWGTAPKIASLPRIFYLL